MKIKKITIAFSLIVILIIGALIWQQFAKNDRPPTGGVTVSNAVEGGNAGE